MNLSQRPSLFETLDRPLASSEARRESASLRSFVSAVRAQDWIVLVYFVVLAVALVRGAGPERARCLAWVGLDLAVLVTGLALVHGRVVASERVAAALHRLLLGGLLTASFLQLRHILPTVTSRVLDAQIASFDLRVFGYEPALAWDRFVTPRSVEWFAFFYFSYFVLVALHVVVIPFIIKDARVLEELAVGVTFVFCVGQLTYAIVPGFGPYAHFAGQFQHPLVGGFWWSSVERTVHAGGALKDIFPSLHTAAPTFLALFSLRHRRLAAFRFTWPIVAFFASQIILATMFLRWHYLADILAGLTLSGVALLVSSVRAR